MKTCVGRHESVLLFVKYCHVKIGAFYLSSPVAPWIILKGTLLKNSRQQCKEPFIIHNEHTVFVGSAGVMIMFLKL